jgi:hypothetical protein
MVQTYHINPEKVVNVVNRMKNLKFAGLEISNGSHIFIDIEFEGMDPDKRRLAIRS